MYVHVNIYYLSLFMSGPSNDFLKMLVYALFKQDKCYCDSIYI